MHKKIYAYILAFVWFISYSYLAGFGVNFFGDFGFTFANYKFFISNPESISFWYANWVTMFLGWSVEHFFSQYGIKIFSIACAAIYAINFLFADEVVYLSSGKRHTVIVFFTSLFVATGSSGYLNRYSVTALLLTCVIFLLVNFFYKRNIFYLIAAGFVGGISVFARLPNIAGIILFIPLLIDKDARSGIKNAVSFLVAWCAGMSFVVVLTVLVGNYEYFIIGLNSLLGIASTSGEQSSVLNLLFKIFREMVAAIAVGGSLALSSHAIYCICGRTKLYWLKKVSLAFAIICSGLALSYFFISYFELRFWHRYLFTGFLLTQAVIFFFCRENINLKKLYFILLIGATIPVVGSANGLVRNMSGLWVLIPVVLSHLYESLCEVETKHQVIYKRTIVVGVLILGLALWGNRIIPVIKKTSIYSVYDELYSKNYGSPETISKFQNELNTLKSYVSPGDSLLVYEQSGILHYYLDAHPFLYTPDPIFWSSKLQKILDKVTAEKKKLPVAIESIIDLKIFGHQERRKMLRNFLKKNGYTKVWSSPNFTVYTPPG